MAGAGVASDRCRRFTGHRMAATSARRDDIDLGARGSLRRWWFPAPEAGYGTCLFRQSAGDPDRWSIGAGTLDRPTGLRTVQAWWTSEASDYFRRADLPEVDTA